MWKKKTDYKIDYVNKIYHNDTRAYTYIIYIGTFNNRVYGRHVRNNNIIM